MLNRRNLLLALGCGIAVAGHAQTPAPAASDAFTISTNTMMIIIAAILLGIIILLTTVVYSAIDLYKHNLQTENEKGGQAGKIATTILMLLAVATAYAQTPAPAPATPVAETATGVMTPGLTFGLLLAFVIVEIFVILYLVRLIYMLTGLNRVKAKTAEGKEATTLWESFNKFKPISEEGQLDVGHSYDGIRELDNVPPPWFTYSFIFTILFAVVYMYRYHVAHTAPLMIQEYEMSVQQAKAEQDKLAKLNPPKLVDENNLTVLGPDEIDKGKAMFTKNCGTCHANDGGGGAGPNLTDDYWIHKGSLKDIYLSIKHGYPDKGMPSWEAMMSPEQINQVTSFIHSLKGTKPAQPKEKQGELFVESAPVPAADSATASK